MISYRRAQRASWSWNRAPRARFRWNRAPRARFRWNRKRRSLRKWHRRWPTLRDWAERKASLSSTPSATFTRSSPARRPRWERSCRYSATSDSRLPRRRTKTRRRRRASLKRDRMRNRPMSRWERSILRRRRSCPRRRVTKISVRRIATIRARILLIMPSTNRAQRRCLCLSWSLHRPRNQNLAPRAIIRVTTASTTPWMWRIRLISYRRAELRLRARPRFDGLPLDLHTFIDFANPYPRICYLFVRIFNYKLQPFGKQKHVD